MTARFGKWWICIAVVAAMLLLSACGEQQTPEAQIRDQLAALEEAAQSGVIAPLRDALADTYSDDRGNDRNAMVQLLRAALLSRRPLHLLINVRELRVIDDSSAELKLMLAAGSLAFENVEQAKNASVDVALATLSLVRQNDQWQIAFARWRSAGIQEL